MDRKRIGTALRGVLAMAGIVAMLTGCGGGAPPDLSVVQTDLETLAIPEQVQVVGLGEASHGVKEYQELKAEVFQALVQGNGCRTFVIEGDFGGALQADAYIHGGEGTAEEAAAKIGFRIYRTKEMESLLEWMRAYNETAAPGTDLHFYGMDMQRADHSRAYLFEVLGQAAPGLRAGYEDALAFLEDEALSALGAEDLARGMELLEALLAEMDAAEPDITGAVGAESFAFARECAVSLYNCCEINRSGKEYNAVRDRHMAEKVQWFLANGDGSVVFINGHNGHIGKVNITPGYDCLGKLLAETLGEQYFAIGTDARTTRFNSQTDEGFDVKTVRNANDLNAFAGELDDARYYIDFAQAAGAEGWPEILSKEQRVTTLNVGALTLLKMFYTTKIIPQETYDGMVVFDSVSPTTFA